MYHPHDHHPTDLMRQRVSDLARAGTPQYLIAKIVGIDKETLTKYYEYQLTCAKSEAIERIGNIVYKQALDGDIKSQSLYLKTQGSSHGWIEKQVVETVGSDELLELKSKVTDLEDKYKRDY
jgi:hypothetical protein